MKTLLTESKNCWTVRNAGRAAFIIDGAAYFQALHEAMRRARRSVMIVGWDLHSGLRLIRDGSCTDYPVTLGRFLDRLARDRDELDIYLLSWDFSMIYAMEREFFPRYKLAWRTHDRIRFCLDGQHPIGACQHQKIVVIDEAIAFSGGLDLSKWRWDTPAHLPRDERRVDPDGELYPPFHDVQMIVDGEAAGALAELARQRWYRACGELPAVAAEPPPGDPWPPSVDPDFHDVLIAIARTLPAFNGHREVREVERLYLDSIAAARSFIYIENQYLSSFRIGEALQARLEEKDGPEIVIVMPKKTGGWLEQHTMDVLRGRIVRNLRRADRKGRLRLYYPRLGVDPEVDLMVHAKIMAIDDHFVRVGSSNLSNRSLGFDSECDLALSAADGSVEARAISAFRNRLLAEHLGVDSDEVARALDRHESLIAAVEALRGGVRTLMPFNSEIAPEIDRLVPDSELLDPEKPIEPKELFDYFISPDQQVPAYRQLLKIILLIAATLVLAALWRWTDLGRWLDIDTVLAATAWVKEQPLTPLLVPAGYLLGGLVSFPVTLLIIATVIIFGPWPGLFYSLLGAELSALLLFLIGRRIGREAVSRFAGGLLNRLNRRLSASGLVAIITVRIIPVAPFSVINVIAGASAIRWRDFSLGTLIGMIPGTVAITIVADGIAESLRHPDPTNLIVLSGSIAAVGAALVGLRQWLRNRPGPEIKPRG